MQQVMCKVMQSIMTNPLLKISGGLLVESCLPTVLFDSGLMNILKTLRTCKWTVNFILQIFYYLLSCFLTLYIQILYWG